MKPLLTLFALLLAFTIALPAVAQTTCVPDLSPVTAQLMSAQALASSGDTAGSLAAVREARAALAAIQSACADAGVTPTLLLEGEFADPSGAFVFNYPLDWVTGTAQRPNANTLVQPMGNSSRAANQSLQAQPLLNTGEVSAFVATGNRATFGLSAEQTMVDLVNAIIASWPEGFSAEPVAETTINGLPAATLRYTGTGFEGYLVVRVVSPELGLIAQVAGVAPQGELDPLIPVIDAIARSVR